MHSPYDLNVPKRNRAVTMLLQSATQQEVATALGVHQTTVHRLQGRLVQFGNTNDRPRSGRLRVTTARKGPSALKRLNINSSVKRTACHCCRLQIR
jgi:DNA-binding IclR family transcriptional regulator